jgi:hypothetical protein
MTPAQRKVAGRVFLALIAFIVGTVALGMVSPAPGKTVVYTYGPTIDGVPSDLAPPALQSDTDSQDIAKKEKPGGSVTEKPRWADWDQNISRPSSLYDLFWSVLISINLFAVSGIFYVMKLYWDDRLVRSLRGASTNYRYVDLFSLPAVIAGFAGIALLGVSIWRFFSN